MLCWLGIWKEEETNRLKIARMIWDWLPEVVRGDVKKWGFKIKLAQARTIRQTEASTSIELVFIHWSQLNNLERNSVIRRQIFMRELRN